MVTLPKPCISGLIICSDRRSEFLDVRSPLTHSLTADVCVRVCFLLTRTTVHASKISSSNRGLCRAARSSAKPLFAWKRLISSNHLVIKPSELLLANGAIFFLFKLTVLCISMAESYLEIPKHYGSYDWLGRRKAKHGLNCSPSFIVPIAH